MPVSNEVVTAGFEGGEKETPTGWVQPSAFIQWKGTDVCMDFHCECGAFCHFDGDFAYSVKCPHCQTVWQMPCMMYPRKLTQTEENKYDFENAKMLAQDDEHCDDVQRADGVFESIPRPVKK